ncbi:protein of unknown function [Burkholderia multivorans]
MNALKVVVRHFDAAGESCFVLFGSDGGTGSHFLSGGGFRRGIGDNFFVYSHFSLHGPAACRTCVRLRSPRVGTWLVSGR